MKRSAIFLISIVLWSCNKKTEQELFVERAAKVYNLYDEEGNLVSYDEAMKRFHQYAKSYNVSRVWTGIEPLLSGPGRLDPMELKHQID